MDGFSKGDDTGLQRVSGYMHPLYAESHEAVGVARELSRCGGWVIQREIPDFAFADAMGCYPLFSCSEWSQLHLDVADLRGRVVSLTMVTDPFGDYDEAYLRRCFPDLVVPFKEHYVIDVTQPEIVKKHRYEVRKAAQNNVRVRPHPNPPDFLDEWMTLHGHLVARHRIEGTAAFSRSAFAKQLSTPGSVLLVATIEDEPVAAMIYFVQGDVVHTHILGCSERGYASRALYGIIGFAVEHFSGSARWLNLMGVPGTEDAGADSIRHFKRGWTRETRTAWLCGVVLDRTRYTEITEATGTTQAGYFPAYRNPGMGAF